MNAGPYIPGDSLIFAIDPNNRESSMRGAQDNNLLPDPNDWSTGTGGLSGYNANGGSAEQNRVNVTDGPLGGRHVTWRTTPDATSGADGGWNSSYYSIDRRYTYRWSIWVRRYTTGTGGTFYLGLNPAPLRNDNGASQGNPYFTCPGISSLTYNQWYLVVGHIFYEGYNGSRHPESGWYENGTKISDKSYCNMGSEDGRWASTTTSTMLRAYHYYTTNTASGIEFAYPRIDKLDGNEPTLAQLLNKSDAIAYNALNRSHEGKLTNGVDINGYSDNRYFTFDGTDDYITFPSDIFNSGDSYTLNAWLRPNGSSWGDNAIPLYNTYSNSSSVGFWHHFGHDNVLRWRHGGASYTYADLSGIGLVANTWQMTTITFDGTTLRLYKNGSQTNSTTAAGAFNQGTQGARVGMLNYRSTSNDYNWNGDIAHHTAHNRALSATEVARYYTSTKSRYGL